MMFDKLKTINNPQLLKLTGINDIIFNKILEILKTEEVKKSLKMVVHLINYH